MKKAKLMLTAIAVFAVVGGALAMKVFNGVHVYKLNPERTACTYVGQVVANPNGTQFQSVYTTNAQTPPALTSACTLTITGDIE